MIPQGAEFHPDAKAPHRFAWRKRTSLIGLAGGIAAVALLAVHAPTARAQQPPTPTPTSVACPPTGQDLVRPPEIVSSGGILSGTIILKDEVERIATAVGASPPTCDRQRVRVFRIPPPENTSEPEISDPVPGPTLRARVGELVHLRFVNEVNPANFDPNFVLDECTKLTSPGGQVYPILDTQGNPNDVYPNCLHASSTANIHFHGTHTNPDTTGDNVYLQVPPLPRDNQGRLTTTPAAAMVGLDEFFRKCSDQLKNPLNYWPATWDDLARAAKPYFDKQVDLLKAYQAKYPGQNLWDQDQQMNRDGTWPIYYIGAVPYCFALPAYTETVWPPPPRSTSPIMGQSPGTHWYHAHKHGSTYINVLNGMTGAFIIEGKYDDDLNAAYGGYMLRDNKAWNARSQPVLVLNQLGSYPNLLTSLGTRFLAGQTAGIDMSVNGRLQPKLQMQPGEVQLWRIVNTSGRNAVYFMAPEGFEWRQIAQDGVQFNDDNYRNSGNRPFYMAPANRVDLLVRAPMKETEPGKPLEVWVQQLMGRGQALPTPANPSASDPKPGTVLMSIEVKGPPVTQNGQPVPQMPFLSPAPTQPPFLADISDAEIKASNYIQRKLVFHSGKPRSAHQHTINAIQFSEGDAFIKIVLSAVEEWTIENTTNSSDGPGAGGGIIDHPLHIHINPFQVTEFFDPNEKMTDPKTGQLLKAVVDGKTVPIPQYRIKGQTPTVTDPRQCELDPDEPSTWVPCPNAASPPKSVWWDVFAIPSGVAVTRTSKPTVVIPGYYKMRSRFVDYKGLYVLHCHILVHEDRGMMFSVEVIKPAPVVVRHH